MLNYHVSLTDPKGHYIDVTLQFEILDHSASNNQVSLWLPTWIPGSYLIREFSRHLIQFSAKANGQPIEHSKTLKNKWLLLLPTQSTQNEPLNVTCDWRIYCWNLSVREAHFDETHAFLNGTSVFLVPEGHEAKPIKLTIKRPSYYSHEKPKNWWLACGLKHNTKKLFGPGRHNGCIKLGIDKEIHLHADNYDELIDCPIEAGELQTTEFQVLGVPHYFVVYGANQDLDLERICQDTAKACEEQIKLFEPVETNPPFSAYWFLLHATDSGYGGLEHRNSTALLCNRSDLPQKGIDKAPEGYSQFMGLCSHEYFHSWHVKRIKPSTFLPYNLHAECYTNLLWVFEGFTSYYDDLILARTGFHTEEAYLEQLCKVITHVHKGPGHEIQSTSESSFDAWTKFYRQDENASNAIVSYYTKGALIALCLDLSIRINSKGGKSLDDVMRYLWTKHGKPLIGVDETDMPALIKSATGQDLSSEILNWTESTTPLPLTDLLQQFGLDLTQENKETCSDLGLTGQTQDGVFKVKQVINNKAAHKAGISAGDELFAINDLKLTQKNLDSTLTSTQPNTTLLIQGFRAERLKQFNVVTDKPAIKSWKIQKNENKPELKTPWQQVTPKMATD